MVNPILIFFLENLTPEVTPAHFDLQVVILEVILGQWSTHTVMGTEIGVNPHGESILSVNGPIDLFDLQVVLKA